VNSYQEKRIVRALENNSKLTSWEYDFINSLADKDEDYKLSDRQNEVLNKISEKTG